MCHYWALRTAQRIITLPQTKNAVVEGKKFHHHFISIEHILSGTIYVDIMSTTHCQRAAKWFVPITEPCAPFRCPRTPLKMLDEDHSFKTST